MMVLATALALAAGTAAAEKATVSAVQYPAWLERGGNSVPLTPGTRLEGNDKLRTGTNARVQLRLGEGSTVRLGENAQFVIESVEDRGIFRAALSVLTGAFRFTTDALRKSQGRDIQIKVKNVTAGIRGTDLWGKSTGERDLVCLLEGKISVGAEGHPTVTLDQPLDFYQKPRDGEPAVAKVDEKQVAIWAQETEISKDGPAARGDGKWSVTAGKFQTRDEALRMNRVLRASGYPAVVGKSGEYPAVIVRGLAGEAEARALMANLRSIPGIVGPTIQGP
jgi:ferric-dicitrate binding protein FerR (iron transport regulator)